MVGYSSYGTGAGLGGFGTLGGGGPNDMQGMQRDRITRALMDVQNPPPPNPVSPDLGTSDLQQTTAPGALGGGATSLQPGGMAAPMMPGGMPGGMALGGGANMQQMLGQQPLLPQPAGLPKY